MRGNNRLLLLFAVGIVVVIALVLFVLLRGSPAPAPVDTTQGVAPGVLQTQGPVATTRPPTITPTIVQVVIAARAIAPGVILRADDLDVITKPRSEVNENEDVLTREAAINRITKVYLNPNQQIKKADLIEGSYSNYMRQLIADRRLEPGKGAFAYATNDLSAAAGLIQENDLIDVVATFAVDRRPVNVTVNGQQFSVPVPGFEVTTKTILQNIRVLKVIKFGPALAPIIVPRATNTPSGETPTAAAPPPPPGTATPLPTLPPFKETGEGFDTSIILVLAVTDQEAEILKFTRESRLTQGVGSVPSIGNASASGSPGAGGNQVPVAVGNTSSANFAALTSVPIVHFLLRARPQNTTDPADPAIAVYRTSGATFRVLVRDYGLPIPEIVYATNAQ